LLRVRDCFLERFTTRCFAGAPSVTALDTLTELAFAERFMSVAQQTVRSPGVKLIAWPAEG